MDVQQQFFFEMVFLDLKNILKKSPLHTMESYTPCLLIQCDFKETNSHANRFDWVTYLGFVCSLFSLSRHLFSSCIWQHLQSKIDTRTTCISNVFWISTPNLKLDLHDLSITTTQLLKKSTLKVCGSYMVPHPLLNEKHIFQLSTGI